jgi:rRNA-processing protein FCF1
MRHALLDTNFILTCVRQKIDFFEETFLNGIQVIIPKQVVNEIKKFEKKLPEARLSLLLFEENEFESIDLGRGKVDDLIVGYAHENPHITIATLDRGIKSRIKNPKLVIRNKKKLEIV